MSKIICGTAHEANHVLGQEIEIFERSFGRKLAFNTADYLKEQLLRNKLVQEADRKMATPTPARESSAESKSPEQLAEDRTPSGNQTVARDQLTPGTGSIQVAAKKSAHPTESRIESQPHRGSERPRQLSPATEHGPTPSAPYEAGQTSPVAKTPGGANNLGDMTEHSSLHPSDENTREDPPAGHRSANYRVLQK